MSIARLCPGLSISYLIYLQYIFSPRDSQAQHVRTRHGDIFHILPPWVMRMRRIRYRGRWRVAASSVILAKRGSPVEGHMSNSGRGNSNSPSFRGHAVAVESPTEAHTPNSGCGNSNSPSFRGHAVAVESPTEAHTPNSGRENSNSPSFRGVRSTPWNPPRRRTRPTVDAETQSSPSFRGRRPWDPPQRRTRPTVDAEIQTLRHSEGYAVPL